MLNVHPPPVHLRESCCNRGVGQQPMSLSMDNLESQILFFNALDEGDLTQVRRFVGKDRDLVNVIRYGATPLVRAVNANNPRLVRELLVSGADPNKGYVGGDSPLVIASSCQNQLVMQMLINYGADPSVAHPNGHSPLTLCVTMVNFGLVEYLVDNGADIGAQNGYGETPLAVAIKMNSEQMVGLLLAKGANVNECGRNGVSPLVFTICSRKSSGIIRVLLDYGANIHIRNVAGSSPLLLAVMVSYPCVVEMLLNSGVDVEERNFAGSSPIAEACERGDVEIIYHLLTLRPSVWLNLFHGRSRDCLAGAAGNYKNDQKLDVSVAKRNVEFQRCQVRKDAYAELKEL